MVSLSARHERRIAAARLSAGHSVRVGSPEFDRLWTASPLARGTAWFSLAVTALGVAAAIVIVVVGLAIGDADLASGGALVACLCVPLVLLAWRLGLHPCIGATEAGVVVRNPLRTVAIPWSEITAARAGYSGVEIAQRDGSYVTAWAVQKSNLSKWLGKQVRADQVAEYVAARAAPVVADAQPPPPISSGAMAREIDEDLDALYHRWYEFEEDLENRIEHVVRSGGVLVANCPSGHFVRYTVEAPEQSLLCEVTGEQVSDEQRQDLYNIGWCRPGEDEATGMETFARLWLAPISAFDAARIGVEALRDVFRWDAEQVTITFSNSRRAADRSGSDLAGGDDRMGIRRWFYELLARGTPVEQDPDAIVELDVVPLTQGPMYVSGLQHEGIEAVGIESFDVVTRTRTGMRIMVRQSDITAARELLERLR